MKERTKINQISFYPQMDLKKVERISLGKREILQVAT